MINVLDICVLSESFQDTIEDTNQFISAHLDSVRNKMLRLISVMDQMPNLDQMHNLESDA